MLSAWMAACFSPCLLGPDFWGLVNKNWRMCSFGQLQSPINIDPSRLLFDPGLTKIAVARQSIEATLLNTGQLPLVTFGGGSEEQQELGGGGKRIRSSISATPTPPPKKHHPHNIVNITGGPVFPYVYQLHQVAFHYGEVTDDRKRGAMSEHNENDDSSGGSEHKIDGKRFPAEIQLLAFNSDLYENFSQAMIQPRGLLGISIIVEIGPTSNAELRRLTVVSQSVTYKNSRTVMRHFHPANLLPAAADYYVTYEGSLTYPGCYETVTWVLMNNPIYITKDDLAIWNSLQQKEAADGGIPAYLSPNHRPIMPDNGRLIRTNINIKYKNRSGTGATTIGHCPSNVYLDLGFRSSTRRHLLSTSQQQQPKRKQQNRRHVDELYWEEVEEGMDGSL